MRGEIIIDLNVLQNNLKEYEKRLGEKVGIIGVVKADGYGHGAAEIVKRVDGLSGFAVATVDEAVELRGYTDKSILWLGCGDYDENAVAVDYGVTLSVWREDMIDELARICDSANKTVEVQIAVNTGMNRIGVSTAEEFEKILKRLNGESKIKVTGIFTHAYAPSDDDASDRQLEKFNSITASAPETIAKHFAASGRALFPKYSFSAVRLGLGMYGYGEDFVKPCMSVVGRITAIYRLEKGESVGYGGSFVAEKRTVTATISLGYADGIPRAYTGGEVIIRGKKRRIVGVICMDYCFAEVDGDVRVDDEVVFLGSRDGETVTAEDMAKKVGTIAYEILVGFKRLKKRYIFTNRL